MPTAPNRNSTAPQKPLEHLKGQIERITFTSADTGYTVAKVKVYGRRDLVACIGTFPNPVPGAVVQMSGEWGTHPRWGEQFKVVFCRVLTPATAHGIEKYLGSGLIKGIGPVMAKRIVKLFGDKTLDIIEHKPERLKDVPGIAEGRIEMISRAWIEQKAVREVMIFLQDHGVSSTYATKIYRQYGDSAIETVQKNPYQLAHDIFGIGFLTADRIAQKMGFDANSPERADAGTIYTLHQASDEGHVCLPFGELTDRASKLLELDVSLITDAISRLVVTKDLVWDEDAFGERMIYLAKFHHCETGVAEMLRLLSSAPRSIRPIDAGKALEWVAGKLGIELASQQNEAVMTCSRNTVSVITGGPGTGKTTIIRAILRIFSAISRKILLAAPTGRAAKRMSEATGFEAKTIHRLLEYNMSKGGFTHNEENRLDAELVIIDEASMLDLVLTYHLLKAIPPGAMLILVGDIDQLPAVGAGSVLKDIISSDVIPVTRLTQIFRQAESSAIITNAHKVIAGEMPAMTGGSDFFFFQAKEPEDVLERIIDLVKDRIPRKFGFGRISEIQVLTPMNRGLAGTLSLNEKIQEAVNPNGLEVQRGGRKFRVGDKVMQIRNNYDKEVYNGDIGFVTDVDTEEQSVHVDIDGTDITYDYSELDELVLAYAVSIHKSQGSEYPAVVIPVNMQHYIMLQRNLLYTGITRGKKLVVLVGTTKAVAIAVRNDKVMMRYGRLNARLRQSV